MKKNTQYVGNFLHSSFFREKIIKIGLTTIMNISNQNLPIICLQFIIRFFLQFIVKLQVQWVQTTVRMNWFEFLEHIYPSTVPHVTTKYYSVNLNVHTYSLMRFLTSVFSSINFIWSYKMYPPTITKISLIEIFILKINFVNEQTEIKNII